MPSIIKIPEQMANRMNKESGIVIMKRNNRVTSVFLGLLISMLTVSIAVASALTQPKADGLIGEQANGYLGLVTQDVSAETRKLVSDVNARRKAGYKNIASKQGTSLTEVEKVGGNKAFEKTLRGNYIRDVNGVWRKK